MKFLFLLLPILLLANNEILQKVDKNLQPESYQSLRKLINIEPDGTKKEFVLYTIKKGSDRVASLFLSPASDKGRSTLRLGDNMWLFIPTVAKPLRIASIQSVTGGVFNNSDILRLDFSIEYDTKKVKDDKDIYILNLEAKNDSVAYKFLEMTIDKKSMTPLKIDCYASKEILIKTILYSNIKDFGDGIVRPSVIETVSPLQKGYKSVMIFGKVSKREFKDEIFTLEFLPKLNEIRE